MPRIATYVPHLRVTLVGTLGLVAVPLEIFSTGFSMGRAGGTLGLPNARAMELAAGAIEGFWKNSSQFISSAAILRTVVFSVIGANGKVPLNADGSFQQLRRNYDAGIQGASGGPIPPFQVSWVATLQTNRVGLTGRGRMFLPLPTAPVQADGTCRENEIGPMTTGIRDLVRGVNESLNLNQSEEKVCVASQGSVKKGLAPANLEVTSIRGGMILDTMRSRRSKLKERYHVSAITD